MDTSLVLAGVRCGRRVCELCASAEEIEAHATYKCEYDIDEMGSATQYTPLKATIDV